jgi:hypothetical protein
MRHWLLGTRAIATRQVLDGVEPVLLVQHDADDVWQMIGASDAGPDGRVTHLWHLIDEDPTIVPVLDLAPGASARRITGGEWLRDASGDPVPTGHRRLVRRRDR